MPKTNFFKINDVLSNNKLETDLYLQDKIGEIDKISFSKTHDEFSLTARFYLENQQSKLQVEDLYDQINRKVFVFLNLDKFEEILNENWIFDQDQFIMELNNNNFAKINNRINSYRTGIFRRLNETIFTILDIFYQKLKSNFHNQYVLEHLNECKSVSKMYTETYSEFNLLNSSYRIGNIIDNILDNILVELRNISKNLIEYIYKRTL